MAQSPNIEEEMPQAYEPGRGEQINRNSPEVQGYSKHLKDGHNAALRGAGARESDKIYSYTFAFNGFAAQLTGRLF